MRLTARVTECQDERIIGQEVSEAACAPMDEFGEIDSSIADLHSILQLL